MGNLNINYQALSDARNLGRVNDLLGGSLDKLSAGIRIIDPASDPAAIGAINKFDAQSKRTQAATTNVQNADSFVQSSVSYMASMGDLISRMSELGQMATDSTKAPDQIALYQTEFRQLQEQLRATIGGTTAEIGGTTDISQPMGMFNGVVLFGPNAAGINVASGSSAGQNITIPQVNLRTGAMLDLIKQDASGNYLLSVNDASITQTTTDAIGALSDGRSTLGGVSSRLDLTAKSLAVEGQNITSALSRIQDLDVATESTRLAKFNILVQSGAAMLTQANQSPQAVLKLLQSLQR